MCKFLKYQCNLQPVPFASERQVEKHFENHERGKHKNETKRVKMGRMSLKHMVCCMEHIDEHVPPSHTSFLELFAANYLCL